MDMDTTWILTGLMSDDWIGNEITLECEIGCGRYFIALVWKKLMLVEIIGLGSLV